MKKLSIFALTVLASFKLSAQINQNLLQGFDEQAACNDMKLKNMPVSERKGYLNYLKSQYVAKHFPNAKFDRTSSAAKQYVPILSPLGFYCPNVGFENFNFNTWAPSTWTLSGLDWTTAPVWVSGAISSGNNAALTDPNGRHTITTIPAGNPNPALGSTPGWDSIARNPTTNICEIQTVCPWGNGSSVRLGNSLSGSQTDMLTYSLAVTPNNSQFSYSYAVVIQDPNHTLPEQPFFTVTFKDQNGVPLTGCGIYNVNATQAATDPTFTVIPSNTQPSQFDPIYYKKWTLVGVDLTAYVGTTITIEFRSADCSAGGHFGYAYVDADCGPAQAVVNMCAGSTTQQVIAPPGFATYQWFGPNNNTTPVPANQGGNNDTLTILNGNVGDVYTLTATSVAGCTTTLTANLQFSNVGVISTNSSPSCLTGSSGIASVTPSGSPSGNYSFLWTNIAGGATVGTSQTATGLSPGTYNVHISAPNCGSYDTTVVIGISPAFFSGTTHQYCGSATWLLAPPNASGIQWYNNLGAALPAPVGTNDSLLATGIANGDHYSVVYTNATGCKDSLVITMDQTTGGSVYTNNIGRVCVGATNGTATVNLNTTHASPYYYNITSSNGYSNLIPSTTLTAVPLTGLAFGTYNISAYDGSCFYNETFKIDTISVDVDFTVAPTNLCGGDSAHVVFNFGAGAPTSCGVATNQCNSPTTFTIGNNQTQNGTTGWPCTYGNWYSNEKYQILYTAADLNAMGISGGIISSIGFNVASIPTTMNTTFLGYSIKMACTPISDLNSTGFNFANATFTQVWGPQNYTVTTGWNTHTFTTPYAWDGISNILVEICYTWVASSTYTNNAIMNNTATAYGSFALYNSDVTPSCPNLSYNQVFNERPVTQFGWCPAQASPSDFTYSWSPNTNVLPSTNVPDVYLTPLSTTLYTLTTTIINGGCVRTDTFTVTVTPTFSLTVNPAGPFCANDPIAQITATTSIPTTGSWAGTGVVSNPGGGIGNFDPTLATAGTYDLIYTAGGAGCIQKDTITVVVNPFTSAGITTPNSVLCIHNPNLTLTTLNAGGLWTGVGVSAAGVFNPVTAGVGTHNVIYAMPGSCPDIDSVQITVNPQPTISISSDTTEGCNPVIISFSSNGLPAGGTHNWNFGDGSGSSALASPIHLYTQVDSFTVSDIYTDANGCVDTATVVNMITSHPIPVAAFYASPSQTTTLNPHVSFYSSSTNTTIWDWDFAGMDSAHNENTFYDFPIAGQWPITLVASNQFGCKDTTQIILLVEPDVVVYVPSAFTPNNNDGKNDVFMAEGDGFNPTSFEMQIFDRWGEKIFTSTDINVGWNGKRNNNGAMCQIDTYVYRITYKDAKGKSYNKAGHVTIVK